MSLNLKKADRKISDFLIGRTIGSGTFGKVKQGTHIPTGQKVAIKILEKTKIALKEDLERVHNQLQILYNKVDHPNIIKLLQLHQTSTNIYIITQFISGKELYESIVENGSLDLNYCGAYFSQLVSAISYLHSKGICHRDIKPQNIMVNGYQLKLIDFGLSKQYYSNPTLSTSCGSPCYAAPQMLKGKYNCIKTDIWAMGVTLYAMAVGHLPYQEQNTERLYHKINNFPILQIGNIKQSMPVIRTKRGQNKEEIRQLIKGMIQVDPIRRCSLEQLKQNQWVVSWDEHVKKMISDEQQNDEMLLHSMSEHFKIGLKQLKEIIAEKQIMSISTYYFLSRRKVRMKKNYNPLNIKNMTQQLEQKVKININRNQSRIEVSGVASRYKLSQTKNKQNLTKNKSYTILSNSNHGGKYLQKDTLNQSISRSCQTSPVLKIHDGPLHLNYLFNTLQSVCQFVNVDLPKRLNQKMAQFESIQQESESSDMDEGPATKYYTNQEKDVEDEQYIAWKDKFLRCKRRFNERQGVKVKKQIEVDRPQWISKYIVEYKGIYLQVKKVLELDMYYLQLPSYFVDKI